MDINHLPIVTPELRQALATGDGMAQMFDPETQQVYVVTPQASQGESIEIKHSDDYIREKLDEAREDIKAERFSTLSTEEILAEARRRHEQRQGEPR